MLEGGESGNDEQLAEGAERARAVIKPGEHSSALSKAPSQSRLQCRLIEENNLLGK